ncbi:MAG TPA: nickel ABC transporter permease [Acidimicrobiales bacterium]|nr:nickel ABC transporter permease [Acidimicrobiales bacterium]
MIRYTAARVVWLAVVVLGVSVVTFGLGVLAPGDPAELALQLTLELPPTPDQIERKREELGLDRPLAVQYARWLGRAARGDLGESYVSGDAVASLIRERLPRTVLLASAALALSVLIAVPLGVLSAYRRDTLVDHICRMGALVGASLPGYLLAYLLILFFAVRLEVLPVLGFDSAQHLVLPALTLALGSAASLTRFARAAVLDVLGEDYLRTARAKGVGTSRVLFAHALRNAAVPIVTVIGLSLGGLLGGAFVVEWIFSWPGLGELAVNAINAKDYPVIQGFVLVTATAYVVVNFLTDLVYGALDPRIRLSAEGR